MLMNDIRDYMQLYGRTSLQDLSRHFRIKESAMQQMLALWIKKGKITAISPDNMNCTTGKCSDCFQCDDSAQQIYIWNIN